MPFFDHINFATTVITSGCASFAASNFGIKLGKIVKFENNSGYKYISDIDADRGSRMYEEIAKASLNQKDAPIWAKDKDKLRAWCKEHQKSAIHWKNTFNYCLIKNSVRHKLIEHGITLKTPTESNEGCTKELLDSYADGENSLYYLLGKKECKQN